MTKVCIKCGVAIEAGRVCKECQKVSRNAASKRYYEAHKDRVKASQKAYIQKLKETGKYADLLAKHKVVAKRYWDRKKAKRLIESGKLDQMIFIKEKALLSCKDQLEALKAYKEKWYKEFNIVIDNIDPF